VPLHALADKSSLSGIRKLIRARLMEVSAPASESFDCLVAVTEACTNALVHGRGDKEAPDPQVSWEIDHEVARFNIKDFATFKETKTVDLQERKDEKDAKEERDGGYGLKMMRQLMDEVDIQFNPGGTTVLLVKYFAEHPVHTARDF
jgi:anti-sigma regulatory factor (Ser/Thr protein kinase)